MTLVIITWILLGINLIIACLCCMFGVKAAVRLWKYLDNLIFKSASILIICSLMISAISIVPNFFIVLYWNWKKEKLQDLSSIPWRALYPTSLIGVVCLFVYRLYLVFNNTAFRYSKKLFICFGISILTLIVVGLPAVIFNFYGYVELSTLLSSIGVIIYIVASIFVCCLFVHGLFKVLCCVHFLFCCFLFFAMDLFFVVHAHGVLQSCEVAN